MMTAIGAKQNNLKWYKGKSIGDGFLWGKNPKNRTYPWLAIYCQ